MQSYAKQQDVALNRLDTKDDRYATAFFWSKLNVSEASYKLSNLLPALNYAKQAMKAIEFNKAFDVAGGYTILADIYAAMNQYDSALFYYRILNNDTAFWHADFAAMACTGMAKIFQKKNQVDSALFYARKSLSFFQNNRLTIGFFFSNIGSG